MFKIKKSTVNKLVVATLITGSAAVYSNLGNAGVRYSSSIRRISMSYVEYADSSPVIVLGDEYPDVEEVYISSISLRAPGPTEVGGNYYITIPGGGRYIPLITVFQYSAVYQGLFGGFHIGDNTVINTDDFVMGGSLYKEFLATFGPALVEIGEGSTMYIHNTLHIKLSSIDDEAEFKLDKAATIHMPEDSEVEIGGDQSEQHEIFNDITAKSTFHMGEGSHAVTDATVDHEGVKLAGINNELTLANHAVVDANFDIGFEEFDQEPFKGVGTNTMQLDGGDFEGVVQDHTDNDLNITALGGHESIIGDLEADHKTGGVIDISVRDNSIFDLRVLHMKGDSIHMHVEDGSKLIIDHLMEIDNTNTFLDGEIFFASPESTILQVKSYEQEVDFKDEPIDEPVDGKSFVPTNFSTSVSGIEFSGDHSELDINSDGDFSHVSTEIPHPVIMDIHIGGLTQLNIGLTPVTIKSYDQEDKDLTISLMIIEDEKQNLVHNGSITVSNYFHFSKDHKVNFEIGVIGGSSSSRTYEFDLIKALSGASITNFNPDNIIFDSALFATHFISQPGGVRLIFNRINTIPGILDNIPSDANIGPDYKYSNNALVNQGVALQNFLNMSADSFNKLPNDVKQLLFVLENSNNQQIKDTVTSMQPLNNETLLAYDSAYRNMFIENTLERQEGQSRDWYLPKFWVTGGYHEMKIDDHNHVTGGKMYGFNGATGIESHLKGDNTAGIAFGFGEGNINGNLDLYSGNIRTFSAGLYHKHIFSDHLYLKTLGEYTLSQMDLDRYITSSGHTNPDLNFSKVATLDPKFDTVGIHSGIFYNVTSKGFRPEILVHGSLGLDYGILKSYEEAGFAAMEIKGYNKLYALAEGGIEIRKLLTISGSQRWRPFIGADVDYFYHDIGDTRVKYAGAASGLDHINKWDSTSPEYASVGIKGKAGIEYMLNKKLSVTLMGDYKVQGSIKALYGSLKVKYII